MTHPAFKQLKSWEQALEKLQANQTSTGTKPKFAFKRKEKPEKPEKPAHDALELRPPVPTVTASRSPDSHLSLTSKSGCLLTFTSLLDVSPIRIGSDLVIADLESCIVDMVESDSSPIAPTSVHIRNVTNSVLLLPVVKGSVLLHDLQHCVVLISGCHQVRHSTFQELSALLSGFLTTTSTPSLGCTHQSVLMCTCRPRLSRQSKSAPGSIFLSIQLFLR